MSKKRQTLANAKNIKNIIQIIRILQEKHSCPALNEKMSPVMKIRPQRLKNIIHKSLTIIFLSLFLLLCPIMRFHYCC
eukprot:XP_765332.1 hypothetical protein [Theileria parva strain Muguga]